MSRAVVITLGCAALALAVPASAQEEMYPGQSVVVNPQAGGGQVLLYPDGSHVRVVPQLLQPGQRTNQVLHLHMPVKHRVVHRKPKPVTETATVDVPGYNVPDETQLASVPPPKLAPRKPAPKPVAQKPAAAKPEPVQTASGEAALPFSFDPRSTSYTPPPPAANTRKTAAAPPAAAPAPSGNAAGLTRRSQIIFAAGVADPAPNALDAIRMLGGDLNSALNAGASRIQLQAYGGAKNDKSSDARRLSLKRALAIRQILIDSGVPSGKIDVRALGGAGDGPLDRVDVLVRG